MGIRHRLKGVLRKTLTRVTRRQGSANTVNHSNHSAMGSKAETRDSVEDIKPLAQEESADKSPDSLKSEPEAQSQKKEERSPEQEKVERHRQRVKIGLLKHVAKHEGELDLTELHNYSERRFLVGHQAFSQVMEELVDGGFLNFDWDRNMATLQAKGEDLIASTGK